MLTLVEDDGTTGQITAIQVELFPVRSLISFQRRSRELRLRGASSVIIGIIGARLHMSLTPKQEKDMCTMVSIRVTLLALLMAGTVTSAIAQTSPPPPPAPRPPAIIFSPNDIYRGPPLPPDRPAFAPRSEIAPPMERPPPLPPMSPRIGD